MYFPLHSDYLMITMDIYSIQYKAFIQLLELFFISSYQN